MSQKEERIRQVTALWYSRPDVQEAIFNFSKGREIVPRFYEGFGKRPDTLEYPTEVAALASKGATSFHCSEEIWNNPLDIHTGMPKESLDSLRKGWDLLIDIDCKYFDFSKKAAHAVIQSLENHGIKNIGIKFSGSKGFHIIVPWNSFPKEIGNSNSKNLFPELPRKIISFLRSEAEKIFSESLTDELYEQLKKGDIKRGIKCMLCKEIAKEYWILTTFCSFCKLEESRKSDSNPNNLYKCPECNRELKIKNLKKVSECTKCKIDSIKTPESFSQSIEEDIFDLIGLDMILVSPRHLFRAPYSLHEKTALVSTVLDKNELESFQPPDAHPLKVKIKDFMPLSKVNEAKELVLKALDWYEAQEDKDQQFQKIGNKIFEPVIIKNFSEDNFPKTIQNILIGLKDGKKRALFILINFFRSLGMEKDVLDKTIKEWNKKNEQPLKEGYIKAQLYWAERNKIVLPPNFSNPIYRDLGIYDENDARFSKNPVQYTIKRVMKKSSSKKGTKS
jgi:DNA primase catalytic subunit